MQVSDGDLWTSAGAFSEVDIVGGTELLGSRRVVIGDLEALRGWCSWRGRSR